MNAGTGGKGIYHPVVAVGWMLAMFLAGCGPNRGTIGVMLAQNSAGELRVHSVPEGLAAHKAGLLPDDRVLLIDGRDVRELSEADLHNALEGAPGTVVKLTILRGDEVLRLTVERREVPTPKTHAE